MKHKQIGSTIYQFRNWKIAGDAQMLYYEAERPAKEEFEKLLVANKINFKIDNDWVDVNCRIVDIAKKNGVKFTQEPYTANDAKLNAFANELIMECVGVCMTIAENEKLYGGNSYEIVTTATEAARLIKLRFMIEDEE
jgi:hypothetical protein